MDCKLLMIKELKYGSFAVQLFFYLIRPTRSNFVIAKIRSENSDTQQRQKEKNYSRVSLEPFTARKTKDRL